MYAVIKTGGKQYSVKAGDVIFVEKLGAEADSEVVFDQVLAVGEEGKVKVGTPVVKKGSMVRKGHRQPYTKVEITDISPKAAKPAKEEE